MKKKKEEYIYRFTLSKIPFDNKLNSTHNSITISQNFIENTDKDIIKDVLYRIIEDRN